MSYYGRDWRLHHHIRALIAERAGDWARAEREFEQARWVRGETWHPEQRMQDEPDGACVLEVPYADDRELVMDILRYGPDCEVLAPAALRHRVRAQVEAMLRKG